MASYFARRRRNQDRAWWRYDEKTCKEVNPFLQVQVDFFHVFDFCPHVKYPVPTQVLSFWRLWFPTRLPTFADKILFLPPELDVDLNRLWPSQQIISPNRILLAVRCEIRARVSWSLKNEHKIHFSLRSSQLTLEMFNILFGFQACWSRIHTAHFSTLDWGGAWRCRCSPIILRSVLEFRGLRPGSTNLIKISPITYPEMLTSLLSYDRPKYLFFSWKIQSIRF